MIKISPSILSADFANLERDIRRISSADYVHVDVMDGLFVPNISIGIPVVKAIRSYIDAMNPACELEVDGGVDPQTAKVCVASGANVLVAGSAVYKAPDIPARIAELRG